MTHKYYSQRTGSNPHLAGLPLADMLGLFIKSYNQLRQDGYFDEGFGFCCVDAGEIQGKLKDVELEMLLSIRKKELWPIESRADGYSEDDLFDVVEFLYQHVSKPVEGTMHSWNDCGMHWETFNQAAGRREYRERINQVLQHYEKRFELSEALVQHVLCKSTGVGGGG
ncbi:MAG: hypothetical protein WD009_02840, partial [Phycisphaeraceae bacterium]